MEWAKAISTAIGYIEENITEDLSAEGIARQVNISPFYFQKGFVMRLHCSQSLTGRPLSHCRLCFVKLKLLMIAIEYKSANRESR